MNYADNIAAAGGGLDKSMPPVCCLSNVTMISAGVLRMVIEAFVGMMSSGAVLRRFILHCQLMLLYRSIVTESNR